MVIEVIDNIIVMATMGKSFRLYHRISSQSTASPYGVLVEHRNMPDALLFDSHTVAVLSADETRTVKTNYKRLMDAYGLLGILQTNTGETVVLYAVLVTGCVSVGKIGDTEIFRVTATHFLSLRNIAQDEERIVEVRKLLNSGTFYFSWSSMAGTEDHSPFDLTLCAQRRLRTLDTDNRFFWNRMLYTHLLHYGIDCCQWLLKVMCGSVEMRTVYVGHQLAKACIVSRLSCERAGTRFNVRGCNDDGHVANFVETEQSIYLQDAITSYVQTRGSIPLFWEQPGVQVGSHRVKMSRGVDASATAFDRHLTLVKRRYGRQVFVNLLGYKEGESLLTDMFQSHLKVSKRHQDIPYVHFDYHAMCRRTKNSSESLVFLRTKVAKYLKELSFFTVLGSDVKCEQTGTIRTNCLDCLDRTNCVQTFFGLELLMEQLHSLGIRDPKQMGRFEEAFRQMWVNNGDQISKIYAGTGALEGKSKLTDGARSITRTIQNNLLDNSKQEAIDILLLGNTLGDDLIDRARILLPRNVLHAPNNMLKSLCARHREYTRPLELRISVATWNVNGGKNLHNVAFKHQPMDEWLLDAPRLSQGSSLVDVIDGENDRLTDLFAIGFEEIVDLNASNIVSSSTANQEEWRKAIHKCINRDQRYVLVTCQQLVGVCLFVFARPELVPFIRDVAVDVVKTGLGGAAGNKGAVAIRMLVHCTSVCFICAHFAAGQSQFADRNSDYAEVMRRTVFPMGRRVDSHDYVFWCGDFNYRIDMSIDEVKEAVRVQNWDSLGLRDQLLVQKNEGNCFVGFEEGEINFPPTYKYDTFSDDYDTSEKSRIPAWTDRVLWRRYDNRGKSAKLIFYGRGELKTSDHRPVIAILDIEVRQVNQEKRDAVFEDVLQQSGPPDGTIVVTSTGNDCFGDESYLAELLEVFSGIGVVTLVRFVSDAIWITFGDVCSALTAVHLSGSDVAGYPMHVTLKTTDWQQDIRRELQLCSDNTVPLFKHGDSEAEDEPLDSAVPSEAFDDVVDGGYFVNDASSEEGSIRSGNSSPVPPWEDISSTFVAKVGRTDVVIPNQEKGSPSKVPPPRPAPPQRPPPPSVTNEGLRRAADNAQQVHGIAKATEVLADGMSDKRAQSPPPPTMAPPPPPPQSISSTTAAPQPPLTPQPSSSCQVESIVRNPPPRIPERSSEARGQSVSSSKPVASSEQPPPVPLRTKVPTNDPIKPRPPEVMLTGPPIPFGTNEPEAALKPQPIAPPAIPPRRQVK